MRTTVIVILTLLGACVSEEERPARQAAADDVCGASKLQVLVGLPFDSGSFETEGQPLRVLPPGSAMTMDHNPARLNVDLDEAATVTRIWCG
ncbi:I78 family peptidase inhibitor [Roseovarius aestuarii]|uniref:Peptidase inhibitor I78 family protein n=1 Tax=Roseovarius aestuarii TaxID=475083 RepID=A0A1X7BSA5_9RHOB|nr:I78 family peptidase inhibitor [Roseovarius aestuarii]SMC12400.1 Peptidase inhibitor I78 family protein [Roseovarius aestuarii]